MRLDMFAQVGRFSKSHVAARMGTFEWFFAGVHSHMDGEGRLKRKRFATARLWTLEGLLIRMRPHMLQDTIARQISYKTIN